MRKNSTKKTSHRKSAKYIGDRHQTKKDYARQLGVHIRNLDWVNGVLYCNGNVVAGAPYIPKPSPQ